LSIRSRGTGWISSGLWILRGGSINEIHFLVGGVDFL
jgi:hypothetical protein